MPSFGPCAIRHCRVGDVRCRRSSTWRRVEYEQEIDRRWQGIHVKPTQAGGAAKSTKGDAPSHDASWVRGSPAEGPAAAGLGTVASDGGGGGEPLSCS